MNTETRVWDPLVRIFHWSLVIAFSISYLTGDEESAIHVYSGYTILGLISFRLIWGFIGSKHARFSDFVTSKTTVISYLKSLTGRKPQHYKGHNPAGGWMVIALIISLFVTTLSGLQVYALEEGLGPFANNPQQVQLISSAYADDHEYAEHKDSEKDSGNEFWEEVWEEIHEAASNITLLLIFIHIGGVLVSSLIHRENLVKAMITGRKKDTSNSDNT